MRLVVGQNLPSLRNQGAGNAALLREYEWPHLSSDTSAIECGALDH